MSQAKRASDVEEKNLSPKEAVILWMKEARQFDSLRSYGCWLAEQPLDAYPLVRLPKQITAAVRSQSKGVQEEKLRHSLRRSQKDVLFLFYVCEHFNTRTIEEEEIRVLKLALLQQRLLTLLYGTYCQDRDRLDELDHLHDLSHSPNGKRKAEAQALETEIMNWPRDEALFWGEISALLEAERLLSERYFSGEPLLFPDTARELRETLTALERLVGTYESIPEGRPPQSQEGFVRWLAGEKDPPSASSSGPNSESDRLRPNPQRTARAIAEHIVLMARAEALADMGDRSASVGLIRGWLRAQDSN